MNEKSIYKLKMFISIAALVVFAAVVVWLVIGLNRTEDISAEQRLENVKQSVTNGAVMCYSVEGFYPESIGYLEENYGVSYDKTKYLVHYRYVSADIRPTISVYESKYENS